MRTRSGVKSALFAGAVLWASVAQAVSLDEVREAIKRKNAGWVAGENSLNAVSNDQQLFFGGAIVEDEPSDYFYRGGMKTTAPGLPVKFDWREQGFTSPIRHQGECGSCVAFAATDTIETQMNIVLGRKTSPMLFSRQYLFSCGGGKCSGGWKLSEAAEFLKNSGIPDEACMMYRSGANGEDVRCSEACSNVSDRILKVQSYSQPTQGWLPVDVVAIKQALLKGPVLSSMVLFEDLQHYQSGVYRHTSGIERGSHAVAIVGWDDSDQSWIVRNSWGPEWGMNGYFKVAWDDPDTRLGRYTYAFEVPKPNGFVDIEGINDQDVLKGKVDFWVTSTFANTDKIQWFLSQEEYPKNLDAVGPVDGVYITGSKAVVQTGKTVKAEIDTQNGNNAVPDGSYYLSARAFHTEGVSFSRPRKVHVLNGRINGSVKVANLKDGSEVSGVSKVKIETESSPLPFTKVVFQAKNLATGETYQRSTNNVDESLIFRWDSQSLKDGDYEIKIEGYAGESKVASEPVAVKVANGVK